LGVGTDNDCSRMIKSFEKLKVRIDQNLNRAEKSEALNEDVVKVENKVACLKQVCHSVEKKLSEGVTSSSSSLKGNDGAAVEKRIRKTAEFGLGQTFQENGRAYASHERPGVNAMSQFLIQGGLLLNDLASNQVQYEIGVEKLVLGPLRGVLDDHHPPIVRERKALANCVLEYDAAKNKLARARDAAATHAHGSDAGAASERADREEKLASELADVEAKLNNCRENVETLMLQFIAKEGDVGNLMLRYFEQKRDYHAQMAERISQHVQQFQKSLTNGIGPTFGCDLQLHLDRNASLSRSRIAFPLRLCVVRLLQLDALSEEGLFRIAGHGLKVKRLVALIDSSECNDEDASHANDVTDPHVFASALKLYLRQLPEPILCSTKDMYREWLSACSCSTADRRGAIAALLHTLPPENFHNLKYFLAFLHHVSLNADVNKMTASNLAIVMAPNLIFEAVAAAEASAASHQDSFSESSVINEIIESLILDFDYYFGDIAQVQLLKDPPCLIGRRNSGFQFRSTNSSAALQSAAAAALKPAGLRGGGLSETSSVTLSVQDQQPASIVVVTTNNSGSSLGGSSSSSHLENAAAPACSTPPSTPVRTGGPGPPPPQKTPVPKPRMNSTRNKTNPPPPPRPTPRNNVEVESNNTRL